MGRFRYLESLRVAPFTRLMALSMLCLFTATWCAGGDEAVSRLFTAGSLSVVRFFSGEWWCLFTAEFVHRDWEHLLWNCAELLLVGIALETKLGARRTALIYFLGALGASVIGLTLGFGGGGSSSAIYALLGAYLARPLRHQEDGQLGLALGWPFAVWWVSGGLRFGAEANEVAHGAHVVGLIVGVCLGAFFHDRDEPELGCRWPRNRRLAAAALASLGLMVGQAPDPRWSLGWHRSAAIRAERSGDLEGAARHWAVIESTADRSRYIEAALIENAARYRMRRLDWVGGRNLLAEVAPTLRSGKIYRDVGFLMAQYEPYDGLTAMSNWQLAEGIGPPQAEVMDAIAMAIVSAEDSTVGRPAHALELALRAVALDGQRTPEFMRTLAWAYFCCGKPDEGAVWMQRAISLNPRARALYVTELHDFKREQTPRRTSGGKKG